MRAASLRVKINLAILVAFVAAAAAFGVILASYVTDRQAATQNRTRVLLAVLAAHRLEALTPLLASGQALTAAKDILERAISVEGVTEASLFSREGKLLTAAGPHSPLPLGRIPGQPLPQGRVFTVSASDEGTLAASLLQPIEDNGRILGYLRLRYSLTDLNALNTRIWVIFGAATVGAYLLLTLLLNILLHRFVLHPVDTLRRGLEAVQSGRYGAMVPVASGDALGRMARAFNTMSARLKDTSESLAQSRVELEEHQHLLTCRVEERTADLARANTQLTAEVAARKQAEDQLQQALALYQAILESTAAGVLCVASGSLDILAWNKRFLEMWTLPEGWPVAALSERRRLFLDKFVDPQGAEATYAVLMQDGERLDTAVIALKDGRFLERRSGPISRTGTAIGRVFSYVDITDEKKRQDQVQQEKVRAEDASKAKGTFLAVMSHEIRTPLNVVIGLTEELLASEISESQRGHLRLIQQSADHLLGVVNDVLDFSKIEAGKLVLERINFNVRELIEGTAGGFAHEAKVKGLAFSVTIAEVVPAKLRGDPGRLRQILLNLLGNALKFTKTGAVSVKVALTDPSVDAQGHTGLILRVADTGIGIPRERLEGLFEEFQQGSGSIARRFGGTGLGLAISRGLAARMGGRIEVESQPDTGSVFTCTVWLLPADCAASEPPQSGEAAGEAASRRLHILLVEDNSLNAAVTRLHMDRMGHDLSVASSAAGAYAVLAKQRFDVVLMDIEMPDVDGITATRVIRSGGPPGHPVLDPSVPIVAVTAHAVEDVRQACLSAGMSGFVTKPINYRLLRQVFENAGKGGEPSLLDVEAVAPGPGETAGLFEPQAARRAMDITWEQFQELSRVSFDEGGRRLAEADAALTAGDVTGAAIAAHTVKGAAATLGAYSCRDLASRLEKVLRAGELDEAKRLYRELDALWRRVGKAYAGWRPPRDVA